MEKLRDIKAGYVILPSGRPEAGFESKDLRFCSRKAEIPVYSFSKHNREPQTTTIYSAHVLILEGIFALQDPRVLELLDMKVRPHARATEQGGLTAERFS